jgi:acetylornithine/N-succinyldiaminopimelate aminotransferase
MYLDFYGGHAVISIGHSHPYYVKKIQEQINQMGFYSNSVQIPSQKQLANKLGSLSGYNDFSLFFCNSGAEANENALKLASFHTKKDSVISFKKAFHGRTSGTVAITDNPKIISPFNANHKTTIVNYDLDEIETVLQKGDVAAIIFEPITGVAGITMPTKQFVQGLSELCEKNNVVLIADEVQSGYGRSGKFFAHQYYGIQPDLITVAKGMGNGFPIGGVLISPKFNASYGLLGTTFGGNHLACAAGLAVLEVIEKENLLENSLNMGQYIKDKLADVAAIKEIRGKGLMIGLEYYTPVKELRNELLTEHHIFVGISANPNVLRLLPPLNITKEEVDVFLEAHHHIIEKRINV